MKKIKKMFTPLRFYLLGIFLLSTVLTFFFVWTHDDLVTNTEPLHSLFREAIYFGNGRYLGNFFVNFCLSNKMLDTFVRSATVTGIIAMLPCVATELNCKTLSVSLALFFGVGNLILRETFIWGHGFYNFAPPVFCILLAMLSMKSYYLKGDTKRNGIKTAGLFLLGFCQQLFSENATCIALLIAILLLVIVIRTKKTMGRALSYLLGSTIGTFVMFVLPEIMRVSYKMTEYRGKGIGADSISEFVIQAFENLKMSLESLLVMVAVWTILSLGLLRILRTYSGVSKVLLRIKPLFYAVFILQPFVSLLFFLIRDVRFKERIPLTDIHVEDLTDKLHLLFCGCFFVYLCCAAFMLLRNEQLRGNRRVYACLMCIGVLSVGELLIITVMGPRCLFLTAMIISVLILYFMEKEQLFNSKIIVLSGAFGLFCLIYFICIMIPVNRVNAVKLAYAEQQLSEGKTVIELIRLPHRFWLVSPDESYANGFYFTHGEVKPPDDYVYITYEEYLQRIDGYRTSGNANK